MCYIYRLSCDCFLYLHTNNRMESQMSHKVRMSLAHFVRLLESHKNAMGLCTTQCKMLLFCVKTIVIESFNSELAHLKKGGGGGRFGCLATFWFDTFTMLFLGTRHAVYSNAINNSLMLLDTTGLLLPTTFLAVIVTIKFSLLN